MLIGIVSRYEFEAAITAAREYDSDQWDDDDECEGHESLNGADMGATVYCDGYCQKPR